MDDEYPELPEATSREAGEETPPPCLDCRHIGCPEPYRCTSMAVFIEHGINWLPEEMRRD